MNPDIFPYVVECADCPHGSVAEVTHEEAEEAIPPGVEATPRQAVSRALVLREWHDDNRTGWMCPSCLEDLE
jgi:hypothetical protein